MIDAEQLGRSLVAALARAGEPAAEAYASHADRGYARFAIGELGQHMQLEEPMAVVRVALGRRVAEVTTSSIDERDVAEAVSAAARLAKDVPEDERFPGFADASEPEPASVSRYSRATAETTPEQRVELLAPTLALIERAGLVATGVLDTTTRVEAVATTGGLVRSHASTTALFKVWALQSAGRGGASGHGTCLHADVSTLPLLQETERAVADALRSKHPVSLPAGPYDVVLDALAVAELVEWLGLIALGARELEQGLSPLAGRIGERITGAALTVEEDPLGELALATPFDREGVARRRVSLIDAGVARGVVHDRSSAARAGTASTGSAAAPSSFGAGGPVPSALVAAGGRAASVEELIGGIERGLFVRRLHYVNGMLEPRRAVMTGLTRDGTFLVERGRITQAVGPMRFTDSLLEAFERCDGLTERRTVVPNWWSQGGSVATPAARIRQLIFSAGSLPG